jgi:hypothetical protein
VVRSGWNCCDRKVRHIQPAAHNQTCSSETRMRVSEYEFPVFRGSKLVSAQNQTARCVVPVVPLSDCTCYIRLPQLTLMNESSTSPTVVNEMRVLGSCALKVSKTRTHSFCVLTQRDHGLSMAMSSVWERNTAASASAWSLDARNQNQCPTCIPPDREATWRTKYDSITCPVLVIITHRRPLS